jgi:DNA-binding IclR family transcriptional regulator
MVMTEETGGGPTGASEATRETNGRGVAAVQSVDRALMVMEILAKLGAAGVTEIATELGVHKSTVSRLIAVLESRGYVEQLSERGKYRLGFSIVRLAGSTSAPMDLTRQGQATLDALATQTGETTNIAILDGDRIINIVEAIGSAGVALRTWVGQSCAAHTTSSGKVLLSELTAADLRSRLGERLESFTPNTIVTLAALEAELATARANGWAAVNEELEIGLNAVSGPIRDSAGEIVAALSVSGPSYRLEPDGFEAMARRAIDAANQISRRLGYSG